MQNNTAQVTEAPGQAQLDKALVGVSAGRKARGEQERQREKLLGRAEGAQARAGAGAGAGLVYPG